MENDLVAIQSALSPTDIVDKIYNHYHNTSEELEWATSKVLKLQIASWCQWFSDNYPGKHPRRIADSEKEPNFKILFLAFPVTGCHLLRVVEACYRVDNALCWTSQAALLKAKKWRNMDQFDYLTWGDHIAWWKEEFAYLHDNISLGRSGHLSNCLRIRDLETASSILEKSLLEYRKGFFNVNWTDPSLGSTFDREKLVCSSLVSLRTASGPAIVSVEFLNQKQIMDGILKRMPDAVSINTSELYSHTSSTMRYIYIRVYMLASIVARIVAHQIGPSRPLVSTLFSLVANLVPVAVAWLLIWDSQKKNR